MQKRISPASAIEGAIALPGDKSISHRYAMLAAVASGTTRIANYSTGADCYSTLGCVRALGIEVEESGTEVSVHGRGLDGLRQPAADLDAGNSGSTIRMLSSEQRSFRSRWTLLTSRTTSDRTSAERASALRRQVPTKTCSRSCVAPLMRCTLASGGVSPIAPALAATSPRRTSEPGRRRRTLAARNRSGRRGSSRSRLNLPECTRAP